MLAGFAWSEEDYVKKVEETKLPKPRREAGLQVLYIGTTERIAKSAPVVGIDPGKDFITLTSVYPGYFAFYASTHSAERYGIVEVEVALLDREAFFPSEWYLEQASRRRAKTAAERNKLFNFYRKNMDRHQKRWKKSLEALGVVNYADPIPKKAIARVAIFDPSYNPTIAHAIAGTRLSLREHKANLRHNRALTRWLMGEEVSVEDWIGKAAETMDKKDKEKLAESLQSKWGLDLFYHGPARVG
jgi:hypothetical protein